MNLVYRSFAIWLLIAAVETLHGILRVRLLNRRLGDKKARQIGVVSGSIVLLTVAWFTIPWIGVRTAHDTFVVGLLWFLLMIGFDLALGRLVFHFSWVRILGEFDPRKGGFLAVGMVVLGFAPFLTASTRGMLE